MPNISTTNKNAIYKYTASITTLFKNDKDPIKLEFLRIKGFTIKYNYDNSNMPIVYTTVAMTHEQAKKFKDNQKEGTVLFNVKKYIENGDMPGLEVDVIKEECVYFMPNSIAKEREQASDPERTEDYGYIFSLGLLKVDLINKSKTHKNGVINKGSMSAALCWILSDHKLLIEPLDHNDQLKQVFIPPTDSTADVIKYLNSLSTFYDTPYRFFMDYDVTYLLSSSGKGLKRKGDINTVVKITLIKEYDESNMEGMGEDKENKMYLLNVSASNADLYRANMADKMTSKVTTIDTVGESNSAELEKNNGPVQAKQTTIRVSNKNTRMKDTMRINVLNNENVLVITKNKIDSSVLTLNKIYYVDADAVYEKEDISGYYLLGSKMEVYSPEGNGYASSVMLVLKRISSQINEKGSIKLL